MNVRLPLCSVAERSRGCTVISPSLESCSPYALFFHEPSAEGNSSLLITCCAPVVQCVRSNHLSPLKYNSIFRCGRPHVTHKEVGSEWECGLPVVTAVKWRKEGLIPACVQSSGPPCCLLRPSGLATEWNASPCASPDSPCGHSAWHRSGSPAGGYLSTDWAASSSLGGV